LLFLWNLFEGVPKFYRDCFEQGVIAAERRTLLERMFFSSKPQVLAVAKRHGASNLRIYGSIAKGREHPASDFDLLINLAERRWRPRALGSTACGWLAMIRP
jgi:hypothetical protein